VKLTYAADWSEYFGYQDGAGNRYFHLDALWADEDVDFIGIDNCLSSVLLSFTRSNHGPQVSDYRP